MFDVAVVVGAYDALRLDLGGRCVGGPSSHQMSVTFQDCFTNTHTIDMSRASQITLATTCATAIGVVAFVHFAQQQDKAVSHCLRHHQARCQL